MKILNGIFTISALALNFSAWADIAVDIPANPRGDVMCDYGTLHTDSGSVVLEAVFEHVDCDNGGIYYEGQGCIVSNCPENHYCDESGVHACPNNAPKSPAGSTKIGDCGHILHVGDKQMYVHQDENTPKPRLAVYVNGETFYATMTTESIKMSKDSNAKLHIKIEGTNYTVHDNSVSE